MVIARSTQISKYDFMDLDICVERAITMYTYYETVKLPELEDLAIQVALISDCPHP
jgi:hypothetical protein